MQRVDHARDQGRLGPNDNEVDTFTLRERYDLRCIGRVDRRRPPKRCDARIARCPDDLDVFILREPPSERVLSRPTTDDQHSHISA